MFDHVCLVQEGLWSLLQSRYVLILMQHSGGRITWMESNVMEREDDKKVEKDIKAGDNSVWCTYKWSPIAAKESEQPGEAKTEDRSRNTRRCHDSSWSGCDVLECFSPSVEFLITIKCRPPWPGARQTEEGEVSRSADQMCCATANQSGHRSHPSRVCTTFLLFGGEFFLKNHGYNLLSQSNRMWCFAVYFFCLLILNL